MSKKYKFIIITSSVLYLLVSVLVRNNVIPFRFEFPILFTLFTFAVIFSVIDEWTNIEIKKQKVACLVLSLILFMAFVLFWILEFIR